jgi:uncharacterized protein YyaL (SSP411 family)
MNRLSQTTSPYLLQHANNPVDWYPWCEEALTRARVEEKPIFLSIGYAACHWCHVMAHESFEDPETAALMNEHFVSIKVDREERPDLDSIYMSATVAMTGSGGWPMSVFLTPGLEPFYAGTYFPPERRYNIPAFREILLAVAQAWKNERDHITQVSGQITKRLQSTPAWDKASLGPTSDLIDNAAELILQSYDWGFGGWGSAPKFPQPMTIEFLLRRAASRSSAPKVDGDDEKATPLKAALHALQAMARGGMYDVVGGGFHRYAVDQLWRVPHFEKMLYDNAQLALVYLHAWQITGEPIYKRVVEDTLAFVSREMTSAEGGFYSSLDADSAGGEGDYYVWSFEEIKSILGEDADLLVTAYGVKEGGNWEGKNILQRVFDDSTLAARFRLTREQTGIKLANCHSKLLSARKTRPHPGRDDKILTAWNALMLQAFAETARAFQTMDQRLDYLLMATRSARFLLSTLHKNGRLHHSWRASKVLEEVFLDDYAALIIALLELYQSDFDNQWFTAAIHLAEEMTTYFSDPTGGFFDTPNDGETLLLRPKDIQDNATPSGNSLACDALLRLAAFTDKADYRQRAEEMLGKVTESALRYPTSFARWLSAADFALGNVKQVAVVGDPGQAETQVLLAEIRSKYRPCTVVALSPFPPSEKVPPLLYNRQMIGFKPTAYVCEQFVCKTPVTTPEELRGQLEG